MGPERWHRVWKGFLQAGQSPAPRKRAAQGRPAVRLQPLREELRPPRLPGQTHQNAQQETQADAGQPGVGT